MSKYLPSKAAFIRKGTQYIADCPDPNKVTGTSIGGILGVSPFETPFSIACRLLRIYREDIDDKPAIKAGKALEPVIIDYLKATGHNVLSAEEVFPQRAGPHEEWEHDFDDPIFGGHVDGITGDGDVVEIKTTSNPEPWLNGVPEHYWLQASLYAKFMGAKRILFAVGVLSQKDVSNPYGWEPNDSNCFVYHVDLHPEIDRHVEYIREWYADYIQEGMTPLPDLSNPRDIEVIKALDAQIDDPTPMLIQLEEIEARMAELKELKERADEIKALLMVHMDFNHLTKISGASVDYNLTESTRTAVDTDALKAAGLYDLYSKTTRVRTFRTKKRK